MLPKLLSHSLLVHAGWMWLHMSLWALQQVAGLVLGGESEESFVLTCNFGCLGTDRDGDNSFSLLEGVRMCRGRAGCYRHDPQRRA